VNEVKHKLQTCASKGTKNKIEDEIKVKTCLL
jgi:hypothetical protein